MFLLILATAGIAVRTLVIGLVISLIAAVVVFFVGREMSPRYAGGAALLVLLVGVLLTLAAAL